MFFYSINKKSTLHPTFLASHATKPINDWSGANEMAKAKTSIIFLPPLSLNFSNVGKTQTEKLQDTNI